MLDITPRKEAERFLRKTEEKYRLASEQTGQLVYDYEIEPDIIHWAGAISQITGYSPEEFMQVGLEGWIGHVHPEDRKRVWEVHEKCMKNGGGNSSKITGLEKKMAAIFMQKTAGGCTFRMTFTGPAGLSG